MLKWLKLSHHSHSGRIRPHEHTSYLPLAALLLIVGIALMATTAYAAEHPGPQAGSIGITGTMPGEPPSIAAVITEPKDQQSSSQSPIKVAGTCPKNTLVEIFKNNIFAGSMPCDDKGAFSMSIDLLFGKNTLMARVYDALNQAGPDSNKVTVYYNALPSQAGPLTFLDFGNQLLLNTDAAFRGVFPQQQLSVPIDIIGGTPPYAVNIQFGDSNNKVISRKDNTTFIAGHIYQKPGNYQITVQASDSRGQVAFLMVAAIVNGQPSVDVGHTAASVPTSTVAKLLVLWPLYAALVASVASFFIGERREKHVLGKRGLLMQP